MQVLKVDPVKPQIEAIEKAARVMQLGGLVIYPTETLYGLGANIMDMGAVNKVFEAKGRQKDKPLSMMFRDLEHAEKFAVFNPTARRLAELFFPGPMTLILAAKIDLGELFGGDRISVRISKNKIVQELMTKVKFPITATSANLSGKADPVSAKEAIEQIGESVDLVLDSGECEHSRPSTIVDVSTGQAKIVREGAIPRDRIVKFLEARNQPY